MADNCIAFDFRENEIHVEIYRDGAFTSHPQCGGNRKLFFDEFFIFDISPGCCRCGQKKNISNMLHFNDNYRKILRRIFAIVLTCILTKYSQTVFLSTTVSKTQIFITKMHGTKMFIYSLIVYIRQAII